MLHLMGLFQLKLADYGSVFVRLADGRRGDELPDVVAENQYVSYAFGIFEGDVSGVDYYKVLIWDVGCSL